MAARQFTSSLARLSADALPPTRTLEEHSGSRVGQVWSLEDHAFLVKRLSELDELCVAVWKRLQTSASGDRRS